MKVLLGIDLGSTSLKAVAFDLQGNIQASSSRPTIEAHPNPEHPEWSVWEPENIWGGIADAIRDVVDALGDPSRVAGLAVTGMGMDGLPIGLHGEWLYPFISWHDTRTYPQHAWWMEKIGPLKIYQTGGHAALLINTINRIMWMKENEPEILKRTDKWLLIEDFVNFMLCGVKASDFSMAATTQVLDIQRLSWSEELIGLAGVSLDLFPPLYASGTVLGEIHDQAAQRTGLKAGTPVVLGGHDYLMGALAAGGVDRHTLVDITGTWEIFMALVDKPNPTAEAYSLGTVWDPHIITGKTCLFIDAVAASMLEWYRNQFATFEEDQARLHGSTVWDLLMEEAAACEVGSSGITFLPHLNGCNAPAKDPKSHGAFIGIAHAATRGMFIRAVIEGLNYQARQMVESIEKIGGIYPTLRAIGGTTRNKFWMQNKADILGRPLEIPEIEEATCLGTAMKAGVGVGLYKNELDAFQQTYKPGKVYQPDRVKEEKYKEIYEEIYLPIYDALKPINHTIFDRFRGE